MDYEKLYKEALERAKSAIKECGDNKGRIVMIESIFPELRESGDESIRKDIKRAISVALDYSYFDKETADDCLAWLEKQGEQKSFDYENANIQQKDWAEIPFGAKDSKLQEVSYHIPEGFHAEIDGNRVVIKKGERKPAWSENEIKMLDNLITYLNGSKGLLEETKSIYTDWLKSLKGRVQPKQEWSEEDNNHFESIGWKLLDYTSSTVIPECKKEAKEDCFWLKNIKQRLGG